MARYEVREEDIEPLLEGLAIVGTGGGGSPDWGRQILNNDIERGRTLTLIDPEDIEDDALVISGGIMGSVKALDGISFADVLEHWEEKFELLAALRVTEELLGRKVNYVVPFEVGGVNTPVIMSLCARLGMACVNGDGMGRSAPETQMSSFIGHGISLTPMPLVDYYGNVVIVQDAVEPTYPDELGRWVVTRGGGMGANNHYPMSGKQLRDAVVPHTITGSLSIGKAVIEARESGGDPVQTAVEALGGYYLFHGTIQMLHEEDRGGFLHTFAKMAGSGRWEGSSAELVIKNEVMLCIIDGKVRAVFPDLLCMLEPNTGRGIMSAELSVETELAVAGVPCHERIREAMRSEVGAKAFSPARFGYPDVEYRPIEELVEIP